MSRSVRACLARAFGDAMPTALSFLSLRAGFARAGIADAWEPATRGLSLGARRQLLRGELSADALAGAWEASMARRRVAWSSRPRSDVLVIGAGAAGVAAADALHEAGLAVTVLEARDAIGGRACTDGATFATQVDLGAARLHGGEANPLTAIARRLGFTLVVDPDQQLAFTGRKDEAPLAAGARLRAARARLEHVLAEAPLGDYAVGAVPLARTGDLDDCALAQIGPLECGVDLNALSMQELRSILPESHGDLYVAEGIGSLIGALGTGLPIVRRAPVTHVAWRPGDVEVTAGDQRYRGSRLVVTASVGQLASGAIDFEPPLPAWKTQALHRVPMGHYEKIILQFSRDLFGEALPGAVVQIGCAPHEPMDFCLKPPWCATTGARGPTLAVAYVGGTFAQVLRRQGAEAGVAHALRRLRMAYGQQVDAAFMRGTMTNWEQLAGGAFSAALPGHYAARDDLRKSLEDTLYFAGEACDEPLPDGSSWCTHVAGAWRSGLQVAQAIMATQP